jgi:hypothetical protein
MFLVKLPCLSLSAFAVIIFPDEPEIKSKQKQPEMYKATNSQKFMRHCCSHKSTLYHAKYQLAPAVTKKAPDKNLKTSFQLTFFILVYLIVKLSFLSVCFIPCTSSLQCQQSLAGKVGSYTQVRTAGDFLSSRKAVRAERCTPKTTATGFADS